VRTVGQFCYTKEKINVKWPNSVRYDVVSSEEEKERLQWKGFTKNEVLSPE